MALPAIRFFRKSFPNDEIYLVIKENLKDLFKNVAEIDGIIDIPNDYNWTQFIQISRKIKDYGFDLGVLFTNSFGSALLFKLSKIKRIVGYRKDGRGILLRQSWPYPESLDHHTSLYSQLVEKVSGEQMDVKCSEKLVFVDDEIEIIQSKLHELGMKPRNPLIGLAPAAAYGTAKAWLPEGFSNLANRIYQKFPEVSFLFLGAPGERALISSIIEKIPNAAYNLAGKMNLRETLGIISLCRLFICNDSGLMHAASAMDIPLIALFGPTRPDQTGPRSSNAKVIHHPVSCAPCKHRECPRDHRCMKIIDVDEVYHTALILMGETP